MENRRARLRSERHRPFRSAEDLDEFERQRLKRLPTFAYTNDAFLRMEDADELLLQRFSEHHQNSAPADDPVRLLLQHPTIAADANPWLYVLALGEKVAALGGHLEVCAIFDDETLTLIREPGPEGQPPILDRVNGLMIEPELMLDTPLDLSDPGLLDMSAPGDDPDALIDVPLDDDERSFLASGLSDWGGSSHPTEEIARSIGCASVDDL